LNAEAEAKRQSDDAARRAEQAEEERRKTEQQLPAPAFDIQPKTEAQPAEQSKPVQSPPSLSMDGFMKMLQGAE